MDDNKQDTETNKAAGSGKPSNVIVLTPDECTKLGLFQQIQVAIKNSPSTSQTTVIKEVKNTDSKSDRLQAFGKKLVTALNRKLKNEGQQVVVNMDVEKTTATSKSRVIKAHKRGNKRLFPSEVIELDDKETDVGCSSVEKLPSCALGSSRSVAKAKTVVQAASETITKQVANSKKERVNVLSSTSVNLSDIEIKNLLSANKPRNIIHTPFLISKEEINSEEIDLTLREQCSNSYNVTNNISHYCEATEDNSKTICQKNGGRDSPITTNPPNCVLKTTDVEIVSLEENQNEVVIVVNTNERIGRCEHPVKQNIVETDTHTNLSCSHPLTKCDLNVSKGEETISKVNETSFDDDILEVKSFIAMNNKKDTIKQDSTLSGLNFAQGEKSFKEENYVNDLLEIKSSDELDKKHVSKTNKIDAVNENFKSFKKIVANIDNPINQAANRDLDKTSTEALGYKRFESQISTTKGQLKTSFDVNFDSGGDGDLLEIKSLSELDTTVDIDKRISNTLTKTPNKLDIECAETQSSSEPAELKQSVDLNITEGNSVYIAENGDDNIKIKSVHENNDEDLRSEVKKDALNETSTYNLTVSKVDRPKNNIDEAIEENSVNDFCTNNATSTVKAQSKISFTVNDSEEDKLLEGENDYYAELESHHEINAKQVIAEKTRKIKFSEIYKGGAYQGNVDKPSGNICKDDIVMQSPTKNKEAGSIETNSSKNSYEKVCKHLKMIINPEKKQTKGKSKHKVEYKPEHNEFFNKANTNRCYGKNNTIIKDFEQCEGSKTPSGDVQITAHKRKSDINNEGANSNYIKRPKTKRKVKLIATYDLTEEPEIISSKIKKAGQIDQEHSCDSKKKAIKNVEQLKDSLSNKLKGNYKNEDWEDEPLINLISNKSQKDRQKSKKQISKPSKIKRFDLCDSDTKQANSSSTKSKRERKTVNYNENENKELDELIERKVILNSIHIKPKLADSEKKLLKKRGRPRKSEHIEMIDERQKKSNSQNISSIEESGTSKNVKKEEKSFGEEMVDSLTNIKKDDEPEPNTSITGLVDKTTENIEAEDRDDFVSVALPKKGGKPRKKLLPLNLNTTIKEVVESQKKPLTIENSSRGRKRKKVDYVLMENPDIEKKKRRKSSLSDSILSDGGLSDALSDEPKKINVSSNVLNDESGVKITDKVCETGDKDTCDKGKDMEKNKRRKSSLSDGILSDGGLSDALSNKANKINVSNNILDDEESDDKITHKVFETGDIGTCDQPNDSKSKRNVYKFTGSTTKMFSAMLSTSLDSNSLGLGEGPRISLITSSKRRRKQIYRDIPAPSSDVETNLNSDGTVICMVCNQNIESEEWQNHKTQIHYNLAWKSGEPPVDFRDEKIVYQSLVQFQRDTGNLKCHKCGIKKKDVRTFMDHLDLCNKIVSSDGSVTCAICREVLQKSQWQFHKLRYHNNLAWRDGEKPLNLNDQTMVMAILNGIYKMRKPLHCEKCGIAKKSVLGYLSHKSICQKTSEELEEVKVTCKLCGNKMMPVSYETHMKLSHTNKKTENRVDSSYFEIDNIGSKGRRKAAERAMDVIDGFKSAGKSSIPIYNKYYIRQIDFNEEQFVRPVLRAQLAESDVKCKFRDCEYVDSSETSLIEHMCSCTQKPSEFYACRRCLQICETELEITEHLLKDHNVCVKVDTDFEVTEEDDQEIIDQEQWLKSKMGLEKEKLERDTSYKITPRCILQVSRRDKRKIFEYAYSWTKEFYDEHYAKLKLYDELLGINQTWQLLDDELLQSYLPQLHRSCDVGENLITQQINLDDMKYKFRTFDLFESATNSNGSISTIFCGGAVSSMAWLPTPHTKLDCDQILAVSVLNNSSKHYNIHENYPGPSIIQFWNFGALKNKDNWSTSLTSKLMFGLCHNYGPVWHMEWCPSGCYDSEDREDKMCQMMGLLAVAGSLPSVPLFVVNRVEEEGLFYKATPVLELELETDSDTMATKEKYKPTRISWTKASGHQYVAVGYSHGVVAIFNITKDSKLLRKCKIGQRKLLPYKVFQAHFSYITVLSLYHLENGNRFLLTASFDRDSAVWDLSNMTKIVRNARKYITTDGTWMTNWLSCALSHCESDCGLLDSVSTQTQFVRNFLSEFVNMIATTSTIKCVTSSDWLNSLIVGTSSGEVVAIFPHQLLAKVYGDKGLRHMRLLFGKTKLIEKSVIGDKPGSESTSSSSVNKSVTYGDAINKYGLVFLDYDLDHYDNVPRSGYGPEFSGNGGKYGMFMHDEYALQSINKVVSNPNLQSSTYYATGYEAGFVRITCMRYLQQNNPQIV